MTKSCITCNVVKPLIEYREGKNQCKQCLKVRKSKYERLRYKKDSLYNITRKLRRRMVRALKEGRGFKTGSSEELLGCDWETAKTHLEELFQEGMNWDNHSNDGWHIDHIRPCSSFDLTDPEQQKKCFHYTNLQPLWSKENREKSDNWKDCLDKHF